MKTLFSMLAAALGFVAGCALFAGLAWASGYNFDTRNPDVGFVCVVALFVGVWFAAVAYSASQGEL